MEMPSFNVPRKGLIIGGAVLGVGAVGLAAWYFFFRENGPKPPNSPFQNAAKAAKGMAGLATGGSSSWCKSRSYPLNLYTCHPDVGRLQEWLNNTKGENLGQDDKFGPLTEAAAFRHTGQKSFDKAFIDTLYLRT